MGSAVFAVSLVSDRRDIMRLPQTGGCQCGKVRYAITEEPQSVYTCHCTACQRLTSSAFSMGLVVAETAFRLSGVEPKPLQRVADSGRVNTRLVCPECGSWICGLPRDGWSACVRAASTIRHGCGRPGTSGPAASSRGSHLPRATKFSKRNRPPDEVARRNLPRCDAMPEPLQPAPPRQIIRNATWLVAWDEAAQSHVYRRDVDLTVEGDTVAAIGPAGRPPRRCGRDRRARLCGFADLARPGDLPPRLDVSLRTRSRAGQPSRNLPPPLARGHG